MIDWVLLDANHEALRLLGAPLERVVGRRATELFGAEAWRSTSPPRAR